MDLEFVAFFGLYVLIVSTMALVRKEKYREFVYSFAENTELRFAISFLELAAGLSIIIFLADMVTVPGIIITFLGYLMVFESMFFLAFPQESLENMLSTLDTEWYWDIAAGTFILIGVYLTLVGFGLL